ncbi:MULTISPECIES: hypothetical protein [unclassified Pseudoalteromonas]|uniref:hypothetical protein n=1 Tax=unclassified Pseudoalteromonas TaxID=194690 RepID=UPI000693D29D|nr:MULTISPECIES: hypothetical protein [unclassified Pseudoalteromonas]
MSDSPLNTHFNELKDLSSKAKTHEDILEISKKIKDFKNGYGYSYQQPYILTFFFLSLAALLVSFLSENETTIIASSISSMIFGVILMHRGGKKADIASNLVVKSVEIKNGLVKQSINGKDLWRDLKSKFSLFNCGDESQEITELLLGTTDQGVEFQIFEFQYVDVREVEEEDSDGNKTTKEERTTHSITGALTKVDNFSGFTINTSGYKNKWSSASKHFNKRFKIKCANEILAAKFFTPSTVLAFEDRYTGLLSLDFKDFGDICLEFDSKILPSNMRVKSIKKTDEFIHQLESPIELEVVTQAKEVIDLIYKKTNRKLKEAV